MRPIYILYLFTPLLTLSCAHTSAEEPIKCRIRNLNISTSIMPGDVSTGTSFIVADAGQVEDDPVELSISTIKDVSVVKFLVASKSTVGKDPTYYYSGWDYADGGGFGFNLPKPELVVRCFPENKFRL